MCSPRIAPHIAAGRPMLFGRLATLPQPLGLTLRCRAFATSSSRRGLAVARGALQSLRSSLSSWVSPRQDCTRRIGYSLRVVGLSQYRPHWLGGPTLPLAVSSAVWFSCKRLRWQRSSLQSNPLSSLASVSSRTKPCLADQPQPASSSLGLLLPTAHEEPKIHLPRARPPATVRLQGLATLLTAYALRSPAGSISHRQRSWDPRFGAFSSRKVSGALPPG
jgi:hypothetical protein